MTLRPKRQITLPADICESLGIETGDRLVLSVEGKALIARPKKARALDALQEIRESFARSGISEKELLKAGRAKRRTLSRERYA